MLPLYFAIQKPNCQVMNSIWGQPITTTVEEATWKRNKIRKNRNCKYMLWVWDGMGEFPWPRIPFPSGCCRMEIFSSGWWDQKIMSRQIAMIGPRRIEHIWRWGTVMKWRCSPPQTAWLIMYLLSRSAITLLSNPQETFYYLLEQTTFYCEYRWLWVALDYDM